MNQTVPMVNRIVLLGASNLTLSFGLVIRLIQRRCGYPSEVLAAVGHGRSYGYYSTVLIRSLPGISRCELWPHLESTEQLKTYALLTDIGNDIAFGHAPNQILDWVAYCIEQLQRRDASIIMTNLSLEMIESLAPWHFKLIRTLFFPFSRLTYDQLMERAATLHRGLKELSSSEQIELFEPGPDWYGPDAIHVLYWKRREFYAGIVNRMPKRDIASDPTADNPHRLGAWQQHPRFACKKLCGRKLSHPQPSGLLADGSIVSMY